MAVGPERTTAIALEPNTSPAYSALANGYPSQKESQNAFAVLDRS